MANQIPVKPINEIEVKSEVSENDKILILDSETEEARLAPKDEIKWDKGDQWDAATVDVWTTTTGNPWTNASVTNSWTTSAAVLDFTIPKWDKGDQWDPWTDAWVYMTQEQYDDLPDSKLTDWISRAIYDTAQHAYKTLLRATDNVLHYNNSDELYADLQFEDWLTPTSSFPAWVSIGNVVSTDWWDTWGLLLNAKTNNWEYLRRLYGSDWKLYFDWWTGVFKQMLTSDDITDILQELSSQLSTVAFSWKSSDLDNDAGFNSVPVMTQAEYDEQTGAASDDKRYFIYEEY